MDGLAIAREDPRTDEVRALLERHLNFARHHTPPEDVHALDVEGLLERDVTLYGIREGGDLLGIGALKQLDELHAEIKSMHTAEAARGRGIGRALLAHLVDTARTRGCARVSLETGSMAAFAPARALYAAAGFQVCPPFAEYTANANSVCMTLEIGPRRDGPEPTSKA